MTDENLDDKNTLDSSPVEATVEAPAETQDAGQAPPQYGVGPFSIREVALGGVWLVAFVVSFFPINLLGRVPEAALVGGLNVWVSGLAWLLTIGLPTIAVFLIALRRLSPQGIRRFGSLGIDQFASVAFSVSALVWLQTVWETSAVAIDLGIWVRSWVIWVELVLMVAGVVLTVFAPLIPVLEQDFQDRPEAPAHRNARQVRAVVPRPKTERPARVRPETAAAESAPATAVFSPETYDTGVVDAGASAQRHDTGSYAPAAAPAAVPANPENTSSDNTSDDTGAFGTDVFASLTETGTTTQEWTPEDDARADAAAAQQAFWALVPVERDVVDDYGRPLFRIGPTAWALVIEDRGEAFVVRHEDGRVGFLHDITGVTRG